MTIASEIQRIQGNIADAYNACAAKGATMPVTNNSASLANTINSISGGANPVLSSLSVNPTTSFQTFNTPTGVDGFNIVYVSAVNSSIDANIVASNIKKDVVILNTTGTFVDTKYGISVDNLLGTPVQGELNTGADTTGDIIFSGVEVVKDFALCYLLANRLNFTHNAAFPDLISIEGENSMAYIFYKCQNMGSVDFPELVSISGDSCLASAFRKCPFATFSFPKLQFISGTANVLGNAFLECPNLVEVSFPLLEEITCPQAFAYCFQNCSSLEDVYFDSLTVDSFGTSTNQFQNMLRNCTGVTLHFPDGLQSVISGLTGYPNFGGTGTALAFDL